MEIQGYFSVPIFKHKIDNILADKIENLVVKKLNNLSFTGHQFTDYYETEKIINIETELPDFFEEIIDCRRAYEESTHIMSNERIQYWVQDYTDAEHIHVRHHHGVYGISGVYWIRSNNHAGPIQFNNPNLMSLYIDTVTAENPFTVENITYKPEKGVLLLFPSYLQHEVLPGEKGIVRTTLAFNFGRLGVE